MTGVLLPKNRRLEPESSNYRVSKFSWIDGIEHYDRGPPQRLGTTDY
jgi:hypothetical protein